MGEEVERLVEMRQQALRNCLISFPVWMGAMIAKDLIPKQNHGIHVLLSLVTVAGFIAWFLPMRRIVGLSQIVKQNPRLAGALSDELTVANRANAAMMAVFVLLGFQGVSIGLLAFAPQAISALVLAEINILVGVTALIGAFFYLERKAAQ